MQKRRPATVTVAAILMALAGLGYLIIGGALFGQTGRARERSGELSGELPGSFMGDFAASATAVVAVLTIVVGLALLGMSNAIRTGSQTGRVIAWVVMGLLLFCGLSGARSGAPDLSGNVQLRVWESNDGVRRQVASETLPDAYSTTFRIVSGSFAVFAMIAMIAAIVLLTRPSAGRWFRPMARPAGPPAGYHPLPYAQTGPFPAPPPAMPYGVAQPSALYLGPPPSAPQGFPPPSAPHVGPLPSAPHGFPSPAAPHGFPSPAAPHGFPSPAAPHGFPSPAAPQFGGTPSAAAQFGPPPSAPYGEGPPPAPGGGPSWSRPVEGPGSDRQTRAEVEVELTVLARRHQRGEITDADYAAARARLTGG